MSAPTRMRLPLFAVLLLCAVGCAPHEHLSFPVKTFSESNDQRWFDMNTDGKPDFAVARGASGRIEVLSYDDDEDGVIDRVYRLSDYADDSVPHLIILLDSIPYPCAVDRYRDGRLRAFGPPQKVIPPFPTLTEVCYSAVLHAPPLPGMIDEYYDPRRGERNSGLWNRVNGYAQPWERRLNYHAKFWEGGLTFIEPRPWYAAELERARRAMDDSADHVTIVYLWSAAAMVCKYGRAGADEVLDGADRLCLQLLYERQGAIKISMMSDHGHNLIASKNVPVDQFLRDAGLNPTDQIEAKDDVVLEINGLVNYAAVQTSQPRRAADALLAHPEIELSMYVEGDRVIVRDASGAAAVECHNQKIRYVPIDRDVLGYRETLDGLAVAGKIDKDGCVSDDDWFTATLDHPYPDGPRRIWDAFHGIAVNPPRVMFTLRDGYCAGLKQFENFIQMASTHGSLSQMNSATFVMSMMGDRVTAPMKSKDVLGHLEPGFEPIVRSK